MQNGKGRTFWCSSGARSASWVPRASRSPCENYIASSKRRSANLTCTRELIPIVATTCRRRVETMTLLATGVDGRSLNARLTLRGLIHDIGRPPLSRSGHFDVIRLHETRGMTYEKRMKRSSDVVLEPVMLSPTMRELNSVVRAVAPKDVVVTLVGESGSGKEVLARRIHELSHRRAGPFVPINCAAIPESLFESELFGHERGAFTGATERVRGKVEASAGGTLFLDELGELPLSMQAKLLRFLENRKFMRVGGSTKVTVDTRLVCATLRPLDLDVQAGRFRTDLYYRIEGITLDVPPLRDRPTDILPLARQFVAEMAGLHGVAPPKLGRAASSALQHYAWPGNVRQLRNAIERLCLLRPGKPARLEDLPRALQRSVSPKLNPAKKHTLEVSLEQPLEQTVHQILLAVLEAEGGNRSRTAERLGISLRTVQRQLVQAEQRR